MSLKWQQDIDSCSGRRLESPKVIFYDKELVFAVHASYLILPIISMSFSIPPPFLKVSVFSYMIYLQSDSKIRYFIF